MKRIGLLSIAFAAAVTVGCGGNNDRDDIGANNTTANDPGAVGTAGDNQLAAGDRDFIEESSAAGMAEVELGKLAAERAQSADVKQFAQMMVTDHTKAGDALKQVASRYNFTPPAEMAEKHRDLRDRLSRLQGAEFDREYMRAMVDGHEDVVDHLESRVDRDNRAGSYSHDAVGGNNTTAGEQTPAGAEASRHDTAAATIMPKQSDNSATMAVNQWAASSLPTTEKHLAEARMLNERLGPRRNTTN
jgi:putative membrane protein